MNKTLILIGKVLLNILIGMLSFLTIIFLLLWGILYKDSHRKRYAGKNRSPFKEAIIIFSSSLELVYKGFYYLLFNKDSYYS